MSMSNRVRVSVAMLVSAVLLAAGAIFLAGRPTQAFPPAAEADGGETSVEDSSDTAAALRKLQERIDRLAEEAARLRQEVEARQRPPAEEASQTVSPPSSPSDSAAIVEIGRLHGHTSWSSDVVYASDGLRAVSSASDGTVRVWDLTNYREIVRCLGPNVFVGSVALSADGVHAVSIDHERAFVWNVQSGAEVARLPDTFRGAFGLAISTDGRQALVSGTGKAPGVCLGVLFDVATGRPVPTQLLSGRQNALCIAFSPRGELVCSGHVDNCVVLWNQATGREVRTLAGHTGHVLSVAFSADGRRILSGSFDGTIRLWDIEGRELAVLQGHPNEVNEVCFLPDQRRALSAGGDGTVRLWDLEAGSEITRADIFSPIQGLAVSPDGTQAISTSIDGDLIVWRLPQDAPELRTLRGHSARVSCAVVSADGATALTGGQDYALILWDLASGREIRRFEGHQYWVAGVAFTPDGQRALSASFDKTLRLWDLASGRELRRIDAHPLAIEGVDVSPDGSLAISGSRDMTAGLWDLQTGNGIGTLNGHTDIVQRASFSPDGRRALTAGGNDPTIRLWDVAAQTVTAELRGHLGHVTEAVFSHDGRHILSASTDITLRLWELESGREVRRFGPRQSSSPMLLSAALSADGRRALSGDQSGTVEWWDVETGRQLASSNVATDVNAVAFTPDGRQAVLACGDHCVRIWRLPSESAAAAVLATAVEADPDLRGTLNFAPHAATSVAFSPDGRTLAVGTAGLTVELCDVATMRSRASLAGHGMSVHGVAFSPDGELLASAGGEVKLRDALSGAALATLRLEQPYAAVVAFSPDGQTLVGGGGNSGNVTLWDVPPREARGEVTHGSHGVSCLSFSANGERFATGGRQGEVQVWETATRRNLATLKTPDFAVSFVGPDGLLATAGDMVAPRDEEVITLWNADLQAIRASLPTGRPTLSLLAASPDGRIIATGQRDGVILWDVASGRELCTFAGPVGGAFALAFSPDCRLLAEARSDQTVILWNVPPIDATPPEER